MGDLQKQLYQKYLQIQNIDPTGLLNETFISFFYLICILFFVFLI